MTNQWDGHDHPDTIDYDWLDLCERAERGEYDDAIYGVEPDQTPGLD